MISAQDTDHLIQLLESSNFKSTEVRFSLTEEETRAASSFWTCLEEKESFVWEWQEDKAERDVRRLGKAVWTMEECLAKTPLSGTAP
jgi:hypothetical protein